MPENVGVYFNDDEVDELLEEFDDLFEQWYADREGTYHRSAEMKSAMVTHMAMIEACRSLGQEPPERPMQVRHWMASALRNWESQFLAGRSEAVE